MRLGEHDYTKDNDGASPKDFGVLDVVYYPDYSPPEAYHDLALLRLNSEVKLQVSLSLHAPRGVLAYSISISRFATVEFGQIQLYLHKT